MRLKKYIAAAITVLLINCPALTASAQETGNTAADITFLSGTLSLTEISSFSFGTQTIVATLQTYPAQEPRVFLDVSDLRGTGAGWRVTALASRFNPGTNPTLPGASIRLLNGTTASSQPGANAPDVAQNILLDCDGTTSANIVTAASEHGLGIWAIQWNGNSGENTNVTLSVPGAVATAGTHTTNITWSLAAAP